MGQFEPYLCFNGTCAEAMRFYEKTLGGKLEMSMTFAEAPPMGRLPDSRQRHARRRSHHARVDDA